MIQILLQIILLPFAAIGVVLTGAIIYAGIAGIGETIKKKKQL